MLNFVFQACRHYLIPMLMNMNFDRSLLDDCNKSSSDMINSNPPPSPMLQAAMGIDSSQGGMGSGGMGGYGSVPGMGDDTNKENSYGSGTPTAASGPSSIDGSSDSAEPPALVIYMVDPFSFGIDNVDLLRLSNLALLRCFHQILPSLPESMRHNAHLQTLSLESIVELSQGKAQPRMLSMVRGLAFSVYSQVQRPLAYGKDCKSLTGFGPASNADRFLRKAAVSNDKAGRSKTMRYLYQPSFVLAPSPSAAAAARKSKVNSDSDGASSGNGGVTERGSTTLFVNYCLSEDQHWLLATASDDLGELVKTTVINVEIPNKTRRKKASARRVGLRRLMDWVLSVMAMALVPWRLVIGRIGRIGHGELRGESLRNNLTMGHPFK